MMELLTGVKKVTKGCNAYICLTNDIIARVFLELSYFLMSLTIHGCSGLCLLLLRGDVCEGRGHCGERRKAEKWKISWGFAVSVQQEVRIP